MKGDKFKIIDDVKSELCSVRFKVTLFITVSADIDVFLH